MSIYRRFSSRLAECFGRSELRGGGLVDDLLGFCPEQGLEFAFANTSSKQRVRLTRIAHGSQTDEQQHPNPLGLDLDPRLRASQRR